MQPIDETYRARLRLLIEQHGTQVAFAVRIGKTPAQVAQWVNASTDSKTGKPRNMSRQAAREIEKTLGLPEGWMDQPISAFEPPSSTVIPLVGDRTVAHRMSQLGDKIPPEEGEESMHKMPPAHGYVRLPILAEAAAGAGRDPTAAELIDHVDVAEEWVRQTLRANPNMLRVLTARGHSMTGQIEDGDAMFVAPCTDFIDDGLYVISVGGLLRVKRLRLRVLDQILSIESNDGSAPETLHLAQADDTLRICGRVIGAWSLKKL
ncbi:helix-turn-helix transcriptional regulator [Salmonella enterica]|nr:helix-turn-helix transcriptional regulator [Salmonella enterica]EFU5461273.1 helix-turn-helix transcriptional regulator [Salmonella enterica]